MCARELPLCIAIAFTLGACSRTALPTARDAAVEVNAPSDFTPDAVVLVADAAVFTQDLAAIVPDAAVFPPDATVALRDLADAVLDTPVVIADTAVEPRDSAVGVGDTTVVSQDSPGGLPDVVGPAPDSRETAPNPFANRAFRIGPEAPAPTPDPACTQYESTDYFLLTFDADATDLKGLAVRGSAATSFQATVGPESDKLTYHIDNFLGGGRVFIQRDQGVYVGQVVIYGSGVPIAWCLRGALTPQP